LSIEQMFDIIRLPRGEIAMGKWIAFIEIKGFYVAAYRRIEQSLRSRPVVVASNGQVLDCCGRAQAAGLRVGARLRQVFCLCPQAYIIAFHPDDCLPLYRQAWDIVAKHSPAVEPTDFHRGFADITHVVRGLPEARHWQEEVSGRLQQQTSLQPCVGIGPGRFVARLAAACNAVVTEEHVQDFLAPLPVTSLEPLGAALVEELQRLGLATLGEVAAISRGALVQQLGKAGGQLHDWLTGQDKRPVQPLYPPPRQGVAQVLALEEQDEVVLPILGQLCVQLARKLQAAGYQAQQLTLHLQAETGQRSAARQCSKPLQDASGLYRVAEQLLRQLWQGHPLLGLKLVAEDLQPLTARQLRLCRACRDGQLDHALQAVHQRYGLRALTRASQLADRRRFAQMILAAEGRLSW